MPANVRYYEQLDGRCHADIDIEGRRREQLSADSWEEIVGLVSDHCLGVLGGDFKINVREPKPSGYKEAIRKWSLASLQSFETA